MCNPPLEGQFTVPGCTNGQPSRPCGGMIRKAQAQRPVLKAQGRKPDIDGWRSVSNAQSLRPPNPGGDVDFLQQCHLPHQLRRFFIALLPVFNSPTPSYATELSANHKRYFVATDTYDWGTSPRFSTPLPRYRESAVNFPCRNIVVPPSPWLPPTSPISGFLCSVGCAPAAGSPRLRGA